MIMSRHNLPSHRTAYVIVLLTVFVASCVINHVEAARVPLSNDVPSWHPKRNRKTEAGGVLAAEGFSELLPKKPTDAGSVPDRPDEPVQVPEQDEAPAASPGELPAAPGNSVPAFEECALCDRCDPNQLVEDFSTSIRDIRPKYSRCVMCSGCTHDVKAINSTAGVRGKAIKMQTGNTAASIFTTIVNGQKVVIKVHGVVSSMVSESKIPTMARIYGDTHYKSDELIQLRAVMKIQDECGFDDINIKEWIAPLRTVVPEFGTRIEEHQGIFAEFAEGASLEALNLRLPPPDLLKVIDKVPHERILQAALFDLLIVQGDRHGENVFLTEDGFLKLIDTRDTAFKVLDAIWYPGAFIHERNRIGNDGVFEKTTEPKKSHWPQLLFDYRCHAPGGKVGTNYPPQMRTCLEKIANMDRSEIEEEYGIIQHGDANNLIKQATNLLTLGFEETARTTHKRINYRNQPKPYGYPWPEPCCKLELGQNGFNSYECKADLLPEDPQNPSQGFLLASVPSAERLKDPDVPLVPSPGEGYNDDLIYGIYNKNPRPPAPNPHKDALAKV